MVRQAEEANERAKGGAESPLWGAGGVLYALLLSTGFY